MPAGPGSPAGLTGSQDHLNPPCGFIDLVRRDRILIADGARLVVEAAELGEHGDAVDPPRPDLELEGADFAGLGGDGRNDRESRADIVGILGSGSV